MQTNDILTGFYLFGLLQGGVLCVTLLVGSLGHQLANRWLALLIAVISIFLLRKVVYTSGVVLSYPHLLGAYPLALALGPLLYLYARTLVDGEKRFNLASGIHFIPMLLMFLSLIPIYVLSAEEKYKIANGYLTGEFTVEIHTLAHWGYLPVLLSWPLLSLYCIGTIKLLRRHEIRVLNHFSSIEKLSLRWLRQLTRLCLLVALVALTVYYLGLLFGYPLLNTLTRFTEVLLVLLLFVVGHMGLQQPAIFQSVMRESKPLNQTLSLKSISMKFDSSDGSVAKYEKSSLTDGAAEIYAKQLLTAMSEQELFLDNSLTLSGLGKQLDIPIHHLSQVINGLLGTNFFEFVNNYRIEYAKKLLVSPQFSQDTVLDIAMTAGFNNKTSFYKSFNGATGITPSRYRKQTVSLIS